MLSAVCLALSSVSDVAYGNSAPHDESKMKVEASPSWKNELPAYELKATNEFSVHALTATCLTANTYAVIGESNFAGINTVGSFVLVSTCPDSYKPINCLTGFTGPPARNKKYGSLNHNNEEDWKKYSKGKFSSGGTNRVVLKVPLYTGNSNRNLQKNYRHGLAYNS